MDKYPQNSYTLKFKDKQLEKEYVSFHKKITYMHRRNAMILILVIFYLFHFVDGQIVAGLKQQVAANKTVVEKLLNDNVILHNKLTDLVTNNLEGVLRQNEGIGSKIENNIWQIRYNTLIVGVLLLLISSMKRFRQKQEYFAVAIGVFCSIAISVIISYVSGTAAYIHLVGLTIIMTWMAIIARVRYIMAITGMLLILIFNNIITSNQFIFNLLHQTQELGTGLVGGLLQGQLKLQLNLPINNFILLSTMVLVLFGAYIIEKFSRENFLQNKENEELLLNILPKEIADIKKKDNTKIIANSYESVTMLFADLVGFTKFSSVHTPEDIVSLLNDLFSQFDELTDKYNIEKIKTMGDGYMLAAGIPQANTTHAKDMANMALQMIKAVENFNHKHPNVGFKIRIGISSGPIVAGVVGSRKYAYDVWGDTVNTASRMESGGVANRIQISPTTYELIKNDFSIEKREDIVEFKGKGKIQTYFLVSSEKELRVKN